MFNSPPGIVHTPVRFSLVTLIMERARRKWIRSGPPAGYSTTCQTFWHGLVTIERPTLIRSVAGYAVSR